MVEGLGGLGRRHRECERDAVALLNDRHEYAIRLGVPEQGDSDAAVGPLVEFAIASFMSSDPLRI
jgi:hypothetical protein